MLEATLIILAGIALIVGAFVLAHEARRQDDEHVGHRVVWNAYRKRYECDCGASIAGGRET